MSRPTTTTTTTTAAVTDGCLPFRLTVVLTFLFVTVDGTGWSLLVRPTDRDRETDEDVGVVTGQTFVFSDVDDTV